MENWPAFPELFREKIVFPTVVDVMTERLVPPATGSDASKEPSTMSPHRDCFGWRELADVGMRV